MKAIIFSLLILLEAGTIFLVTQKNRNCFVVVGNFNAESTQEIIEITWDTYLEKNVSAFCVEKTADRINYFAVDTINAVGDSKVKLTYSVKDKKASSDLAAYRLVCLPAGNAPPFVYRTIKFPDLRPGNRNLLFNRDRFYFNSQFIQLLLAYH